jgi:hypothetical protein
MPSRRERFERISREVREQTNRELAGEISTLTFLAEDDVERLLPRKVDKEQFSTLMAIVASGTDDNTKVARLKERLDEVGHVLLKILKELL